MSKRDDFKIDLMSSIDDDIIEKHTKKRFALMTGKSSAGARKTVVAMVAIIACFSVLGAMMIGLLQIHNSNLPHESSGEETTTEPFPTGQVPIYQGMTVSDQAPITEDSSDSLKNNSYEVTFLGKTEEKADEKDEHKHRRPVSEIVGDSLTVEGDSEYMYYSKPNQDIYITVHIHNPDEYEILSFTLNEMKYQSYMFEQGSDSENLILKVNVGDIEGVVEYTIDAIKYVEGTKIKDVLMGGDKTVRVAITPEAPHVAVTDITVGLSDVSLNVSLDDEKNLVNVSGEDYFAVVCNEDAIISKQSIGSKDKTAVSFTELEPNTTYRYAIIGIYDAIDGEGKCIHVLYEEEFTTQAPVSIGKSYIDGADVRFNVIWNKSYTGEQKLDTLELYDGETKLSDLDVTAERIADLPFDKEFILVATYTYNGKQYKTNKTIYSPKTSEGLEMRYGVVVGVGSCSDTFIYINAPVAENAFKGNTHIEEVYLGSGVEAVESYAFAECPNLTTVSVSKGVKLKERAFEACGNLRFVTFCGELGSFNLMAFPLCPNIDFSAFLGSGGFVTHTNNDEINVSITNTNEGHCYTAVSSENTTPWLRLVASKAIDLKKGVYMEIRIDKSYYGSNVDSWFDVMLWDRIYMIPGRTEFGEGAQCLIRPNVNNITWYKEGFGWTGGSEEFNPKVVDGKHYLTVELSWDEAKDSFVYTINGVSAPQGIISYMNEKWGGASSYAYVGFCFYNGRKGEDISCTVLKFGTSAETATVPGK